MKYTKVSYEIIGRFEAGRKYGIVTKMPAEGYTADELPGIAIRKRGGFWYVDHAETGLAIITTGSKSRDAAAAAYKDGFEESVSRIMKNTDRVRGMIEQLKNAPFDSDVAAWEKVEYTTTYDHRLDEVTAAAKKAGCIVRPVKSESYIRGGAAEIIGDVKALEAVRGLIADYAKRDAEKAAETVPAVAEEKQPEPAAVETTPEEIKKSVLDEIRGGDFSGILAMLGSNRGNNAAIIRAGIAAGVFKPAEMERFVLSGIMPDYHTFDAWKQAGYMVRKGEKCAFKAVIWKYTDKNPDTEEETENTELKPGPDFIHKIAYMFGADQVDKIERKPFEIPDGCTVEKIGGREYITGNTRPHKEMLKAAGYRWNKTRGAWYR